MTHLFDLVRLNFGEIMLSKNLILSRSNFFESIRMM